MLSETSKLRIRAPTREDLSIARGNRTPALTLEGTSDNRRPAVLTTGPHDLVHERNQLIREANGNLLAHTKMVPNWYEQSGGNGKTSEALREPGRHERPHEHTLGGVLPRDLPGELM